MKFFKIWIPGAISFDIMTTSTNIESLTISGECSISKIMKLLKHIQKVKHLSISVDMDNQQPITNLQHLQCLTHLIFKSFRISFERIKLIFHHMPKLKKLKFSGALFKTQFWYDHKWFVTFDYCRLSNYRKLHVYTILHNVLSVHLTSFDVQTFSSIPITSDTFEQVKALDITLCDTSSNSFSSFTRIYPNVTYLTFGSSEENNLTNEDCSLFVEKLSEVVNISNLKTLNICAQDYHFCHIISQLFIKFNMSNLDSLCVTYDLFLAITHHVSQQCLLSIGSISLTDVGSFNIRLFKELVNQTFMNVKYLTFQFTTFDNIYIVLSLILRKIKTLSALSILSFKSNAPFQSCHFRYWIHDYIQLNHLETDYELDDDNDGCMFYMKIEKQKNTIVKTVL
ncbi:unnamed protein product [Didymodactylos carnosus]|uniref:Uncharacterized protein n=2 Tax=Didymodactylos carnosus TaxID=1234261 RepID=A0A815THT5_9BILA|nr:unnamed protein product [Didymodactylos carnosus]CAF4367389.1 unnamed protein product [Didymodactylos carnosus]